jgi:hypothetical protein
MNVSIARALGPIEEVFISRETVENPPLSKIGGTNRPK